MEHFRYFVGGVLFYIKEGMVMVYMIEKITFNGKKCGFFVQQYREQRGHT